MNNTQNIRHPDSSNLNRSETVMSAKEFKNLKLFFRLIKSNFNDFHLVDGAFRAYSNDQSCIVETGFSFFRGMHFNIPDIKQCLKSISTLDKKTDITVKADISSFKIADQVGDLSFSNPSSEVMDNKFIPYKDIAEIVLRKIQLCRLIVNDAISKNHIYRLKMAAQKLGAKHICLKHDKSDLCKGELVILGKSKDSPVFGHKLKRPLLSPIKENHYFNLEILPALFNRDDMYLKCYYTTEKDTLMAIYSTRIDDLFVNIYSQSGLSKESE